MREINSNSILILNTINHLSNQNFIQKIENGIFVSRHLVQQTLQNKYKIKLKLDTIYRHFRILHYNNLLNYFRGSSWKDCFILSPKIKNNFFCSWKKDITLTKSEIEAIFNQYSKNKLLIYEKEYRNFHDYYENKKIKFKSKKFLILKWKDWCQRIPALSLDITKLSYINFKKYGTKNVFNLWKDHAMSKDIKFYDLEKAIINFENYSKINKKMIIKNYNNTSNQTAKAQEKADYKWDFKKTKDVSDKIKNWLDFELKLNWKELYYWKNIKTFDIKTNQGILKLGWTKMPHPDFNKDEILLFRIDTAESKYLLSEHIDTVEVIENEQ